MRTFHCRYIYYRAFHFRSFHLLVPFIFCCGILVSASAQAVPTATLGERFDAIEQGLPLGWKVVPLGPISIGEPAQPTRYSVVAQDGRTALQAVSVNSSAGLLWETEFNPRHLQVLEWDWKISRTLTEGDLRDRSKEDAPARLMVMFPFDGEDSSFWERLTHSYLRGIFGKLTPGEMLVYAWSNKAPRNSWIKSGFSRRIQTFSVESGAERTGRWVHAVRNIAQDYRARFNKPLPERAWLGILVDTDNTDSSVESWFDSISLRSATLDSPPLDSPSGGRKIEIKTAQKLPPDSPSQGG